MKPSASRALPALLLLALFPAALSAVSVFDVIRLTQERYPDREIIRIIQVTDSRFVLTADDTTRLKKEGVTEPVIREMLSRPAKASSGARPSQPAAKSSRSSTTAKDARSASTDSRQKMPAEISIPSSDPAAILDEIVRLTKAGLSDETVLAYTKAHRADLPAVLPADRLNWLKDSGVSRNVILYLTAIDVRASGEGPTENAVYDTGEEQSSEEPAPPPQNPPQENPPQENPPSQYADQNAGADTGYYDGESYPVDGDYPQSDYLSYYGGYGYPYPYYADYYYPWWPSYFFVDVGGFFGHHHGHGHGHGHHGHGDGNGHHNGDGHWGDGHRGDGSRGSNDVIASQTWRNRPTTASSSFSQSSRQTRNLMARGSQGSSSIPSRGFDRGSRGNFGGPRVVGRPGFSGSGSGMAMNRAPIGRPGGRPGVVGRPGFSGSGSVGRAPIARSGGSFSGGRSGGFSGGMSHGGGGGRGGGRGR